MPERDDVLPAPTHRRAGDYVFVSTVHPIGSDGEPIASHDLGAGRWLGSSPVERQATACLAELQRRLEVSGSDLSRILRLELFLADPQDLADYLVASRRVFGDRPPPRTTIAVGDEHLLDGCRVSLHAVGYAGPPEDIVDVIDYGGADPRPVDHSIAARGTADFVFCAGLPATDFQTGLAVAPPANSYHSSGARAQAEHAVQSLAAVLDQAGSSIESGLRVHFYEPDLRQFEAVDRVWGQVVGVPPARSSMACRALTVPGALFMANLWALTEGGLLRKEESREGIPWHPIDLGRANFSPGIRAGGWFFTSGQIPVPDLLSGESISAPSGLPFHFDDAEIQTDATLDMLRNQIEANGYALDDVVEARVFLVNPRRDFRGFARAWERLFADAARMPALSVIASSQADGQDGVMLRGPKLEVEFTCYREAS